MDAGKKLYSGVFIHEGLSHKAGVKRYRQRRDEFKANFNHPVLIFSVDEGPGGTNIWPYIASPIYQEPLFIWLTGINQYPAALYLDNQAKKEILFLPPKDAKFEFWQGMRMGTGSQESKAAATFVCGIEQIEPLASLHPYIAKTLAKKARLGLLWYEGVNKKSKKPAKTIIKESNWRQNKSLKTFLKKASKSIQFVNICEKQFALRLPLDKVDQNNAKKANDLTALAFKETLPKVKDCGFEYELCGKLDGHMLEKTPYGKSFPTIAASGKNATILHYEKYDDSIKTGELFLLDFGLRWGTMHADISRTIPTSGKYNPLQALLYSICLKAQKSVEQKAKAGVTIKELDDHCWDVLETSLEQDFLIVGGAMQRNYTKAPHGVSHLMGEMEHDGDPFGEYKNSPMQEGWMISNEPGLYGHFKIVIDGKKYNEPIGIRIEDNLLIRKNDCINLSKNIPREIDEIEALMR